jgi:hypothetical protein
LKAGFGRRRGYVAFEAFIATTDQEILQLVNEVWAGQVTGTLLCCAVLSRESLFVRRSEFGFNFPQGWRSTDLQIATIPTQFHGNYTVSISLKISSAAKINSRIILQI